MKRAGLFGLILVMMCTCAPDASQIITVGQKPRIRLVVFAAASLSEAFSELATAFSSMQPGVVVRLNLAGSNTLRAQIEQGATADVFASANTAEMEELVAYGFISDKDPQIFLTNKLVVITPAGNPARITTLADLALPGTKLVVAAQQVPAGQYARLMLENAGEEYMTKVLANVVSNETTVKQVVAKVQLGEADAGFVYASDAIAAPDLPVIEIPIEFNVLAKYPIAPLATSSNQKIARQFIAFVLSPTGQDILSRWGFTPLNSQSPLTPH
jgi:molybdate transport system substrate-binding protein